MSTNTLTGARTAQPAVAIPEAMSALQAFGAAIATTGISPVTVNLINMRASQINGCAVCLEGGIRDAKKSGETDERLILVAAWRETLCFTPAERAALALTEAITRSADTTDCVPDDVWDAATEHYDETQLAGLVLQIANINLWNRLNIATRQHAGTHTW